MQEVDLDALVPVLAQAANVTAAWVFGSTARGQVREGSDLDLAVLFASPPGLDELADLRAELQLAAGFEDVDLTVLNSASAVLRFEALCGRLLLSRDDDVRAEFASLSAREYEDEMALAERHLRAED